MAKVLVAAMVLWPVTLAGGAWALGADRLPWLAATVYLAGGRVCHQNPERSFHTHGVKWPVCARCSGLYLAAPAGAGLALMSLRRPRRGASHDLRWFAVAAVPTVVTFGAEHFGLFAVSALARFLAALPLGAVAAGIIVRAARSPAAGIR